MLGLHLATTTPNEKGSTFQTVGTHNLCKVGHIYQHSPPIHPPRILHPLALRLNTLFLSCLFAGLTPAVLQGGPPRVSGAASLEFSPRAGACLCSWARPLFLWTVCPWALSLLSQGAHSSLSALCSQCLSLWWLINIVFEWTNEWKEYMKINHIQTFPTRSSQANKENSYVHN